MAEGAECDGGVTEDGLIGEHHLQDGNVANDGGGDGGDEEENGSDKKESDTDPVGGVGEFFLDCRGLYDCHLPMGWSGSSHVDSGNKCVWWLCEGLCGEVTVLSRCSDNQQEERNKQVS